MRLIACLILIVAVCMTSNHVIGEETYHQVGIGSDGEVAFEYIGVVQQKGFQFTTYGYFTYIQGVPDSMLFFDAYKRDQTQARFTFHSESKMKNRSIVNNVFSLGIQGEMDIYFRQDPVEEATMQEGEQFAVGEAVATMKLRGQSIITTIAPSSGVNTATIEAEQTQQNWKGFREGEKNYTFGRPKSRLRLSHTGYGLQFQKEPLVSKITIAGNAVAVPSSNDE